MIYVTGYNDYSRLPIRLALNEKTAIQIDDRNWSTGIIMQRCWFGIRRVITESYSIWDDGSGGCVGTRYHVLADHDEILSFCDKACIDPPNWIVAESA